MTSPEPLGFVFVSGPNHEEREAMSAALGGTNPVDTGIAWQVTVLRDAGIRPFSASQGGSGTPFREPTVRFGGNHADLWKAYSRCIVHGMRVKNLSRLWRVIDGEPTGPYNEITFRPDWA